MRLQARIIPIGILLCLAATVLSAATHSPEVSAQPDPTNPSTAWIQVAAHAPGLAGSFWKTDLVLLNPTETDTIAHIRFHDSRTGASAHLEQVVAPGSQSVLVDVVGQLGLQGTGSIEVTTDRPVLVTSRTYTALPDSEPCLPGRSLGQSYAGHAPARGLAAGEIGWVPHLVENDLVRSNLAFTNTGPHPAAIEVELLDDQGQILALLPLNLQPGTLHLETRPLAKHTGRTDLEAAYARVSVITGSGVLVSGSLIDARTNSPVTLPVAVPSPDAAGARAYWVEVAARSSGVGGSLWRTDLGLLNPKNEATEVEVRLHVAGEEHPLTTTCAVGGGHQVVVSDLLSLFGVNGVGSLELRAGHPVLATTRTYGVIPETAACFPLGSMAQLYPAHPQGAGLAAGEIGWLAGLAAHSESRTNLTVTNTGNVPAAVRVDLHADSGERMATLALDLSPGEARHLTRVFRGHGGTSDLEHAFATVRVLSGSGILASASLIDSGSGEPTTIALVTPYWIEGRLAPPRLSVAPGTLPGPLAVTISAPPGACLRYTTDGSVPDEETGEAGGEEVNLTLATHTVVKAIAVQPGWISSEVTEGQYAITYTVGGEARRLTGPVVLRDQSGTTWTVPHSGPFTCPGPLLDGTPYLVEVAEHPPGQRCAVRNGAGTLSRSAVSNLELLCEFATAVEHKIFLFMAPKDLAELYRRDPFSDEGLPGFARLALEGPNLALREIRFRGSSARTLPKKSFRVRFDKRQDVLFRASRTNLNAMYSDPSMMREALAMGMYLDLGRPAPRTRHFDLYMNEVFEGLYIHVDRIDLDLIEHFGLSRRGTLIRDEFRSHVDNPLTQERWSAFGFDIDQIPEAERAAFLESTFSFEGTPNWESLVELLRWVHQTPAGPAFVTGFTQRIDIDAFLDWLAIHVITGDIDSFWDDYWLYLDHENPAAKWQLIPWDKDLTFGSITRPGTSVANDYFSYEYPFNSTGGDHNQLIARFFATPELVATLAQRVQELLTETFTQEWFEARVDQIAAVIRPSVEIAPFPEVAFTLHPSNHHGAAGHFNLHVDTLKEFFRLRQRFIDASFLAPEPGPPYTASADLTQARAGDEIYLTDAKGWTIARLRLAANPVTPGWLTVTVEPQSGIEGVDRLWRFHSESAEIEGELTLFYRNDRIPWLGLDNWVTDSDAPVGNQWQLTVARYAGGYTDPMPSLVNPYANTVTTTLTLPGPTDLDLALVFR